MPKILFSSPCGPYPKLPVDKDPIDYFYYRNTYKQKMFQLRSFQSWHSLHFMAQNIAIPSVVLENPSEKIFQKEINSGDYDILSISFTILLTKRVFEMVEWVKQNHPSMEIILGGYGTAVFKESFETSDKLKQLVNHICYGEGTEFINSIILKKWGIENNKEQKQNLLPAINSFFRTKIELFKQIIIVGGLGCVYGCSFCSTSSQFNKKHISLFTAKQLISNLIEQSEANPKIQSAIIYEEDFLLNRAYVLEFIKYYKDSKLYKNNFLITVFASSKSIKKYSIQELLECGIGTIFIGVESFNEDVISQEKLSKRNGENIRELFQKLHYHGINTLGSLIIGWDSQDEGIAKLDSQQFISLNPTFYQVVPLHIVPGTKLWDDMKKENRISLDYKTELDSILDFNFETKKIDHDIALKLVFSTYSGLVQEGGAWPFRLFQNLLNGYVNLKDKEEAVFVNRANIYRKNIFITGILAFASRYFFFGKGFRSKWNNTMILYSKHFPLYLIIAAIISPLVFIILALVYAYGHLKYLLHPMGDQPNFIRKEY